MEESSRSSSRTTREVHLRDYFIVLARYKWLIVAAVIVTLSSTVLYIRRQVPIYQSHTRIIIELRQMQRMFFRDSMQLYYTDWLDLGTQIEAIKTTPVLAAAVKQLGLITAPEGTQEFSATVNGLRGSIQVTFVDNTKMITIIAKH